MTDEHNNEPTSVSPSPATENTRMPESGSMKTSQTIVDGGNMEDRDGPLSNPDSATLIDNVVDSNLSVEKD